MIHEIGVELGVKLAAQKCPVKVIDGPEPTTTTTGARERIVIEHDEDGGDTFSGARSQHKNPKMRMIRNIGAKITIYAQAANVGATHWEHRRRLEHILDLVMVALDAVLYVRKNGYKVAKAKFVQPDDLAASEVIAGAKYELTLSIERGVFDQTWTYEKRPEAVATSDGSGFGIKSTTSVHGPGDAVTPETGCGG